MIQLQPNQLQLYFTKQQETDMQKEIVACFTGKVKPGIYSIVMEKPGKLAEYFVGFIVEQPNNPRPFIITVIVEAVVRTSRGRFNAYVDNIMNKADKLPERKAALLRNQQQIKN